ncbi:DUF6688 domain-containing protein [Sphingobacterium athyrii]|uniref:Uncharacterized protein n=1 Tax=Sphingobacterium athyrii TaxID=2152717 RepID=A0A363NK90_9SPHI|nr:DUF6688 family protein [Sphingobacterium athyrii]PUV21194.1 hypothetical protein DCO56_28615 [Sphingobacterium athyrii]
MYLVLFLIIAFFAGLNYLLRSAVKKQNKKISSVEYTVVIGYILSIALFGAGLLTHSSQYHEAVDPVDGACYLPFGGKHALSLFIYFVAFNVAVIAVWIKGRQIPPIPLVLALIILMLGSIISIFVLTQVSYHDTSTLSSYVGNEGTFYFIFTPLFCFCFGIGFIWKIIQEEKATAIHRNYRNPILNKINRQLSSKMDYPVWALILLVPFFVVMTAILILFGQDSDSMAKVFTETTTWAFSQKMHPPILDHRGHYLCTVAAKGDPAIVKPLRLGNRHGNTIIVNRQLLVANAFEEILSDLSPKLHRYVRYFYDRYGYNISTRINSVGASNLTYRVMKPLEYTFLFFLYLFYVEPEKKIAKQYT